MTMARYLLKRFLLTLPALWLVLTLVFLMIHIVPRDPVEQMLGEGAAPGQLGQLRHMLGLDLPLHTQYAHYLWQLGRGDLGNPSSFNRRCARLSLNVTLQLFSLHSSRRLSAPRSPFPLECSPPIAAVKPPTALSEGVLVQND